MRVDRKEQIPRYLLGELTEEEREDFERDFFDGDDLAAEVLAAEEKLMEDYVSGILDPGRRRQFENLYLSNPAHREELKLHESLRTLSGAARTTGRPSPAVRKWAVAGLAACIAFLALGLLLLFRENHQLQNDIRNVQASQKELTRQALPATPNQPAPVQAPAVEIPKDAAGATVPAILLLPGIREAGAATPVLHVPSSAPAYLLMADVGSSGGSYHALIETVEGSVLYEAGPLRGIPGRNGHSRLQLALSHAQLEAGDYILVLRNGTRTIGEYYFRLAK